MPQKRTYFIGLTVLVLAVAAMLLTLRDVQESRVDLSPGNAPEPQREANDIPAESLVRIGNVYVSVEIATSAAAVTKGLSGRPSLPPDAGMLFAFDKPDRYRFWMPDMRFPLDILWIDGGRMVDIDHDVSNVFDSANPVFYTPSTPVRYVLEVNAGFANKHGIRIGDAIEFLNIP